MHYSLAAIALLTLTASHLTTAMPYPEIQQYDKHNQSIEQARDPCTDHPEGVFASQLKKCAALNYQSARHRLEETIEVINDFLDGNSEIHEGADTIGKQQRALAASSAAWEDYYKNTCQLVYLQYFGGSFARIHELDCMTLLTEERIKLLDRIYSGWVDE